MSTWEISAALQHERWQIHLPLQCSQRFGKHVDHMILFLNEVVHQTIGSAKQRSFFHVSAGFKFIDNAEIGNALTLQITRKSDEECVFLSASLYVFSARRGLAKAQQHFIISSDLISTQPQQSHQQQLCVRLYVKKQRAFGAVQNLRHDMARQPSIV